MPDSPYRPLEPMFQIVASLAAHRAILGILAAKVGEMSGDKAAFLRDLIRLCSADLEAADFLKSNMEVDDQVRAFAHKELADTLGRLQGSPKSPE